MRKRRPLASGAARIAVVLALVAGLAPAVLAAAGPGTASAAPIPLDPSGHGRIRLHVTDSADGSDIGDFTWLINVDNSGDSSRDDANCLPAIARDAVTPEAGTGDFPAGCQNPSVHSVSGAAPVLTQGDQADLSTDASLQVPNGTYLISVTAPGHKIDGVHFTVNGADPALDDEVLEVAMNPMPEKTLTVRVNVFDDNASTNGEWDIDVESYVPARGNQPARNDMSGFVAHLSDVLGAVTTDVYGNALCTEYQKDSAGNTILDPDGFPIPLASPDNGATGGQLQGSLSQCVSGPDGQIAIPNLGPNRYAVTVQPPDPVQGETTRWMQTTTLEGGHDWDSWNQEGGTGYDTERVIGGEKTPPVDFGFVPIDTGKPSSALSRLPATGGGTLTGIISIGRTYVPTIGGQNNGFATGFAGTKLDGAPPDGLVAVSCLAGCDFAGADENVYTGRADADGRFTIAHLPAGTYNVALWDEQQSYILTQVQVDIRAGETTDMANVPLAGWFTELTGHVFLDANDNGRRDPGEQGVPDFGLTVRGRSNYLYDQGMTSSTTNEDGFYDLSQVYPLTQFVVVEAFDQRYKTTGITYQADNQPSPTTTITSQVDIDLLPVIGLSATLDWGVQPYARGENGGIVGTVSYDSTRNETNARKAGAEDYQPSVPDLPVQLWTAQKAGDGSYLTTGTGAVKQFGVGGCARPEDEYGLDASGSGCQPLQSYTTETWTRPTGCVTRDQDGNPVQQLGMPTNGDQALDCLEAPLSGVQIGGDGSVDGNYGFGDLGAGDYLVEVVSPIDQVMAANGKPGRHLYKFTDETSINVFSGDNYVPQDGYSQQGGAAGDPVSHVDPAGDPREDPAQAAPAVDPQCAGATHTVDDSVAPDFQDAIGGSIFNGQDRHQCDVKLIRLSNGRSIAPTFFVYTDVPIASRFYGLVINDLGVSTNKKAIVYGEAEEIAGMPIDVYDETGRHKWKVESDFNGFYEMLLPSTDTYNCPLPAGPCPNVYRLVANDPGQPGSPNLDHNPAFRSIGTEFQAWPGVVHPVDQAVTPIGATIEVPGATQAVMPQCSAAADVPQLYRVDDPVVTYGSGAHDTLTISGVNFGSHAPGGSGQVTVDGTALPVQSWSTDATSLVSTIKVGVPGSIPKGAHTLMVTNDQGLTTPHGITVHVTGNGYSPHVFTVGKGKMFDPSDDAFDPATGEPAGGLRAIQRAVEAAHAFPRNAVVVVYPNDTTKWAKNNPDQAYYENLVIHSPLRLQGVGPGGSHVGADGATHSVPGATIDGSSFWSAPAGITNPDGTLTPQDSSYATEWQAFSDALPPAQHDPYPNGATILEVAERTTQYLGGLSSSIDGLTVTGGDQQGFPNNINGVGGAPNGQPRTLSETQGGGIFVNANILNLQISDNVIRSNGGAYGGGIRVGTPQLGTAPNGTSNNNPNLKVLDNRIIANGGSNLAGGVALFNGANNYEIARNDICGNYSTEYGGGISHYGYSPGGRIHDNKIVLNSAYDEGGGVMVAGELPAVTTALSKGAGSVEIANNLIQGNLSNDDGGGVRFLMAAGPNNDQFTVTNNIIANNVATHEGGGVALDDTPNVRFVENTVVRNITTATSLTSTGRPAPAGLGTGANSALLQQALNAKYGANAPRFSEPVIVDDVFADNRAGTWTSNGVAGIGAPGDPSPVNIWDIGSLDNSGTLHPHSSVINSTQGGFAPDATDTVLTSPTAISDLHFKALWDLGIDTAALRTNPQFRQALIVTVDAPIGKMGDYHLDPARPAGDPIVDKGVAQQGGLAPAYGLQGGVLTAPNRDIDGETRPQGAAYDIGADEIARPSADLKATVTNSQAAVSAGTSTTFTVKVTNTGPNPAPQAAVTNTLAPALNGVTWTCAGSAGASCAGGSGSGTTLPTVNLPVGGTATYTVTGTVPIAARGSLVDTATAVPGPGLGDPTPADATASASVTIAPPVPTFSGFLDQFNRANANTLGSSWAQLTFLNAASVRVNGNQAVAPKPAIGSGGGSAYWSSSMGATQAAGFTFPSAGVSGYPTTPVSNTCVLLKANGGTASAPQNLVKACYLAAGGGSPARVVVSTVTLFGLLSTTQATFPATFAAGDGLVAEVDGSGVVAVWKTSGATTSLLGAAPLPTTGSSSWTTGSGRIGLQLPELGRVDDFKGGNQ